jgi:diacylglycerol kinase family enzyme
MELADGTVMDDLFMALVTNCDPWTFLGNRPVSPTPAASFDTGLDLYTRTRMGTPGVLWAASKMLRGTGGKTFGSRVEHDLDRFVLRSSQPLAFQVDGDHLDERDQIRFQARRRALQVYV